MGQCARMVSLYISFVLNKLSLLIDPVELQALSSRKLRFKIDQYGNNETIKVISCCHIKQTVCGNDRVLIYRDYSID